MSLTSYRAAPPRAKSKSLRESSLPCATTYLLAHREGYDVFSRPGGDLLFQVLRLSTIGAGEFYGRVRDGIGYRLPAIATRPAKDSRDARRSTAAGPNETWRRDGDGREASGSFKGA